MVAPFFFILVAVVFAIVFAIFFWLNRKNTVPVITTPDNPGSEKIYVTYSRAVTFALALSLIGIIFIFIGVTGMLSRYSYSVILGMLLMITGCFLGYRGVLIFIKRNAILQLRLTPEGIYYKPEKWYSRGRNGSLNGLSVYFTTDWNFSAYHDLSSVVLQESAWMGNSIYIVPKNGKSIKLLFFIDDKAQVVALYTKIKSNIEDSLFGT